MHKPRNKTLYLNIKLVTCRVWFDFKYPNVSFADLRNLKENDLIFKQCQEQSEHEL